MSSKRKAKLVEQGMIALGDCNPELAVQFFERAQQQLQDDVSAAGQGEGEDMDTDLMDALADALLQAGRVDDARRQLELSTRRAPARNPAKWFYLAQLQHSHEALASYRAGIAQLESAASAGGDAAVRRALGRQCSQAYSSVAELFLTDLCFEADAEAQCEAAIRSALQIDPDNMDGRLSLASLRLSQSRPAEACAVVEGLYTAVTAARETAGRRTIIEELQSSQQQPSGSQNEGEEEVEGKAADGAVTLEFCVSLAKILMECAPSNPALGDAAIDLLSNVLDDDDELVEVWYLLGIAYGSGPAPDYPAAQYHFESARELMDRVQASCVSGGGGEGDGVFACYSDMYAATLQHLAAIANNQPLCLGTSSAVIRQGQSAPDDDRGEGEGAAVAAMDTTDEAAGAAVFAHEAEWSSDEETDERQ